jgi:hypothetical protein
MKAHAALPYFKDVERLLDKVAETDKTKYSPYAHPKSRLTRHKTAHRPAFGDSSQTKVYA